MVMEWPIRKKGSSEVIVRAVMSLYRGGKTKVRVESESSEEFLVLVGVHQESVLSSVLFATMMDVIIWNASENLMNEILFADD